MITMKGQFNSANVMIDEIDDSTKEQIQSFLNNKTFANSYIAIMPDCHAGKGAVIGFTMKQTDYIIPNIIGVDIGCGMLSCEFDVAKLNVEAFDGFIKQNIPAGFNIHNTQLPYVDELDPFTAGGIIKVCADIGISYEKAFRSLGTLGGGNHFIEAGLNGKGNVCVTIHSGSRNFGMCVATFYQDKAKENLKRYFIADQYKDVEFLFAYSVDGKHYLDDMRTAQMFARINRQFMMRIIAEGFFNGVVKVSESETIHNYIADDNIIRKGACSAYEGETVILPFNMRDGIAIGKGKGNAKYNFSAPHGAGRILSRNKAKEKLNVDEFIKTMSDAGVYTTTANEDTLDEAPDAYKDKEIIIKNVSETIDIIDFIKPIYNFKSAEKKREKKEKKINV